MRNLIRAEWFLFRKMNRTMAIFCWIVAYAAVFIGAVFDNDAVEVQPFTAQALAKGSLFAACTLGILVGAALATGYQHRIQIYEIMAGKSPTQILWGRVVCYVPLVIGVFLLPASVVLLLCDHGTGMRQTLMLVWVLVLRFLLCTIFLSPLTKDGAWVTTMSAILLFCKSIYAQQPNPTEAFRHSIFGCFTVVQCATLDNQMTPHDVGVILLSSVLSCGICYAIGFFTLQKKWDLETRPIAV